MTEQNFEVIIAFKEFLPHVFCSDLIAKYDSDSIIRILAISNQPPSDDVLHVIKDKKVIIFGNYYIPYINELKQAKIVQFVCCNENIDSSHIICLPDSICNWTISYINRHKNLLSTTYHKILVLLDEY
jgi:hypothetical protein